MPSFINQGLSSYVRPISLGVPSFEEPGSSNALSAQYGRVVDVIVDSTHPQYNSLGGAQSLYGVFFQPLFTRAVEQDLESPNLQFAYCKQNSLRQVPIRNEIVQLEMGPSAAGIQERHDEGFDENVYQQKIYWTCIVPVWNNPHLNLYPDVVYAKSNKEVVKIGENFVEDESIRPLQLSQGDVVLEGRHGQSLRFGGTVSKAGSLSEADSNGKPFTILRNGQASTEGNVCAEDINADDASIYLVSDHRVPITEANHKFAAAVRMPGLAKDYRGKQIVANADQIFVNARKDNLELAAKEHASINAKTVSLDGEDYLGLDAKKVYLGTEAQGEKQPVLRGWDAINALTNVLKEIQSLINTMANDKILEPYTWVSTINARATAIKGPLDTLIADLPNALSKKVFTE